MLGESGKRKAGGSGLSGGFSTSKGYGGGSKLIGGVGL